MITSEETEAEFYRLMGAFLLEFSQLEATIRMRLGAAIKLPEEYSDIVLSGFDFARLCAVTEAVLIKQSPAKEREISAVFSDCQKLNQDRVRVAHGLITHDQSNRNFAIRHVSRSFNETWNFGKGELRASADKAQALMQTGTSCWLGTLTV